MTEPSAPAEHPLAAARHPRPRHVSPADSLSWLGAGWRNFTHDPGVWIAISLIFFVMLVALLTIPLLGMMIVVIGFPVLVAGMVLGCDAQAKGQPLRVEHLFSGLKVHGPHLALVGMFYLLGTFIAGFLPVLIAGALLTGFFMGDLSGYSGLAVVLGSAAFGTAIIATVMTLLITALWFATPLVVLKDTPPLDAMKMSLSACFGNLGAFTVLGVLIYVLSFLALLPLGLGMIVLVPVLAGTLYASYRDVFGGVLPAATPPVAPPVDPSAGES
ncbi:MAG TPA: BPSS1780 family membrane protein [Rhodocyclaceae bacterium]|nr:BPSS1780 family membrane protein [Burkholderiaceae bacterium]HNF63954.1 BPSS1780 family membrane protein [Rhodocyclaceae bacterium]HNG82178.1 BPSS1780 family membrane protein [Burkholderiaceae bacterium]